MMFTRYFFILSVFFAAPAFAASPEIEAVETYLNGITTLQARFVQTAQDGGKAAGVFMLKRPGRLRFEYDAPVTDFIVADGTLIYYYDGQMKQQRSTLITSSLADFFLRPNLKLSGDISVSGLRREGGLLHVTLVQASDKLAGSLTLMFHEKPMRLEKWRIVDAQGQTTDVALQAVRPGVSLNDRLFHYYDPLNKKSFINK